MSDDTGVLFVWLGCAVGGLALGAGVFVFTRFVAGRFVEPKYASLIAAGVSSVVSVATMLGILGVASALVMLWRDMARMKPKA